MFFSEILMSRVFSRIKNESLIKFSDELHSIKLLLNILPDDTQEPSKDKFSLWDLKRLKEGDAFKSFLFTAWKVSKYGVLYGVFWSVFSCFRNEYGDLRSKSPFSFQIHEITEQKKLRIWTHLRQCFLISWSRYSHCFYTT